MIYAKTEIKLKNGCTAVVRNARPEDAEQLIEYLRTVSGESPFLLREPDEVNFTEEGERILLQSRSDDPSVVMLNAWVGGRLAGNCTLTPKGARRKICHRADVSIALRKAYWGLGLGKALLTRVLTLAKELGYEQVELEVISGNDRALGLYQHVGFVQTGRMPNAFQYDDGTYRDEIQMVRRV